MKKRTFLLLEILIAFVLVSLCIVPLVKQPLKLYREEILALEKMERERMADWAFTEIREKLLTHEILWAKIPAKGEKTERFLMRSETLSIPGCRPKLIKREFQLIGKAEKMGYKEEIYRQLLISIFLDGEKYDFRLPVKKIKTET